MKKKVIRKKQITPEQGKQMKAEADERFSPGVDERLGSMVAAAMQRKIRVRYLSVNPSSLLPHVPEALERAKAFLVGEPSSIATRMATSALLLITRRWPSRRTRRSRRCAWWCWEKATSGTKGRIHPIT